MPLPPTLHLRHTIAILSLTALGLPGLVVAEPISDGETSAFPQRFGSDLAHTYSIVARDPETGQLGVAVQSHWFQVGTVVAWAEPGIGAVATQSFVEVAYGPRGLALMEQGIAPRTALEALLAEDEQRAVRQVALVDASGRVAAWTGEQCIEAAGHIEGDGFTVQANLMHHDTVWPAMAKAYREADGPFAERLLAALEAAEAEGGDIRGRQSAALVIVSGERTNTPWKGRLIDLRVDDHPDPLVELRRLVGVHRAYQASNAGDEAMAEGDVESAVEFYTEAARRAPDIVELPFWQAVTLFSLGKEADALPIFREVFRAEPIWLELLDRLREPGLLPDDDDAIARIRAVASVP